jgi:hypothetical protein
MESLLFTGLFKKYRAAGGKVSTAGQSFRTSIAAAARNDDDGNLTWPAVAALRKKH